ncbi:OLC1v1014657C1 [Oldenlandia corymbosa var. corymbosa]|uniref:OLC1v1014657C1 n=1 Tax=Oldenlandia corymbosa var. corymbosa TaxID=529605 RepID=A0AAV1E1F5_OLDCO|nr:OLC1v1014657C1 [Oldenlandia corymbosa var. corymbosa]
MKRLSILTLVLLFASFSAALSRKNDGTLLPNGNFEMGPKPSQMKGTQVIDPKAIANWEISGFVEYIKSGQKQGDMLLVVPQGKYAVRLGDEASIKTKVKVNVGWFYSISFTAARTCAQEELLNVSVSPNKEPKDWGMLPMQTMYSSDGWDSYCWGFLAEFREIEISIHNPGKEKHPACGPLIDSVALKALRQPIKTRGNLLKNGNFEEGPFVFPKITSGVLIPPNIEDDHSPLPGWMIESAKAVKYIDSDHFAVPEGQRAVELVAGRESAIAQVVRTNKGWWYDLVFSVGDAQNSCEGSMLIEAFAGMETLRVPYDSHGKGNFIKAKHRFRAVSSRTTVRFLSSYYHMKSDNSGALCGPVIDDVKLFSVRTLHK